MTVTHELGLEQLSAEFGPYVSTQETAPVEVDPAATAYTNQYGEYSLNDIQAMQERKVELEKELRNIQFKLSMIPNSFQTAARTLGESSK